MPLVLTLTPITPVYNYQDPFPDIQFTFIYLFRIQPEKGYEILVGHTSVQWINIDIYFTFWPIKIAYINTYYFNIITIIQMRTGNAGDHMYRFILVIIRQGPMNVVYFMI